MEASRELNKLEQAATARKLTEAEKQKIRQRLAAKIQKLNQVCTILIAITETDMKAEP